MATVQGKQASGTGTGTTGLVRIDQSSLTKPLILSHKMIAEQRDKDPWEEKGTRRKNAVGYVLCVMCDRGKRKAVATEISALCGWLRLPRASVIPVVPPHALPPCMLSLSPSGLEAMLFADVRCAYWAPAPTPVPPNPCPSTATAHPPMAAHH